MSSPPLEQQSGGVPPCGQDGLGVVVFVGGVGVGLIGGGVGLVGGIVALVGGGVGLVGGGVGLVGGGVGLVGGGVPHGSILGPGGCLQVQEHSHSGGGQVLPASAIYLRAGWTSYVFESDTINKNTLFTYLVLISDLVKGFMQYHETWDFLLMVIIKLIPHHLINKWFITCQKRFIYYIHIIITLWILEKNIAINLFKLIHLFLHWKYKNLEDSRLFLNLQHNMLFDITKQLIFGDQ